ncbi:exodeoxyribonuclease X [Escherichia coli]|nr:exodeoxyribonuclease X [Escherichia coli]
MLRIIDTETCGLQGGIVEIASVDVIDGKIVNPMSHLVRPDRPISPQADGDSSHHRSHGRR